MPTGVTAYRFASTITSVNPGTGYIAWTNPTNVGADDDSWATAQVTNKDQHTYWLRCIDFGFSSDDFPVGCTIDGIELVALHKWTYIGIPESGGITDAQIYARKTSGQVGANHASAVVWPEAETTCSYGGPGDGWGVSWTASEVTSADFGIDYMVYVDNMASTSTTISVDYLKLRIFYGPPRPAPMASVLTF